MAVFQTKNGRWRVQIRRKVGAVDETYDTREEAEARQAVADGSPGGITLGSFIDRHYLASSEFKSLAQNSQDAYRARFVHLKAHFSAFALCNVDTHAAISYRDKRFDDASRATIAFELSVLSAVLSYAVVSGYLKFNPLRDSLKRLKGKPVRRSRRVSVTEVNDLQSVGAAGGVGRDLGLKYKDGSPRRLTEKQRESARFFFILSQLGCRAGELSALKPEDLRLKELLYRSTLKGGETVWRRISRTCYVALTQQVLYLQQSRKAGAPPAPFLFSTNGAAYRFKNAAASLRNIGVMPDGWHPHALRREFISSSLEAGLSPHVIIAATGHLHASSLELYDVSAVDAPARLAQVDDLYNQRAKRSAVAGALIEQAAAVADINDPWAEII